MRRLPNGREFCFKIEMKHKRIHITEKFLFSIKVMYNFEQQETTKHLLTVNNKKSVKQSSK